MHFVVAVGLVNLLQLMQLLPGFRQGNSWRNSEMLVCELVDQSSNLF